MTEWVRTGYIDYPACGNALEMEEEAMSGAMETGSETKEFLAAMGVRKADLHDPGAPYVHPLAYVAEGVVLGRGTKVWQFASVMSGAVIGENCAIGPSAFVGEYAKLGNWVRVQHAAHITGRMQIGDSVFYGNGVMSGDDKNPWVNNPQYVRMPPIVESDVSIGMAAVLLPGVRLGRGCRIGAGAVVTKDVPPMATVAGNPARQIVPRSS